MAGQIKLLLKLQLTNLFGLNVIRHSRDKKKKNTAVGLLLVYIFLVIMVLGYTAALSAGLCAFGLAEVLPAYLAAIVSVIIFFFTMLKTGSVIFQKDSYETMCSLPLKKSAVVLSRFIRMYLGDAALSLAVILPGLTVRSIMTGSDAAFWLFGIVGTLFIPLVPMTAALIFGALITALSSRMRHGSIVSALLSIVFLVAVMVGTSALTQVDFYEENLLTNITDAVNGALSKAYPPAVWLSDAMNGKGCAAFLFYTAASLAVFAAAVAVVSSRFHSICRRLNATFARHNYKMESLQKSSVLASQFRRELKRYLASGIYMMNTAAGPIMGTLLAFAALFFGTEVLKSALPGDFNVDGVVPTVIAAVFCMMPTTSTSVSLEGRQWWITKSLPIPTKTVMDAKILVNLAVFAPFYVLSEVAMLIAVKPTLINAVWMVLIPAVSMLFSFALGLRVNLAIPVFDWENETAVVKQSMSAMLGGLGGFVIIILTAVPQLLVTAVPQDIIKLATVIVISAAALLLYRSCIRFDLRELD